MEIELPDGTVLEAPDDADVKTIVRGYTRSKGMAELKAKNPGEYDTESSAYKAKYGAMGSRDVQLPNVGAAERQKYLDAGLDTKTIDRLLKSRGSQSVAVPDTQFAAGVGSGMERGVKGLTNLALPDSLTPDFASDQELKNMDERDEDLPLGAKLIGGAAATAPLSGGTGALFSTASKAAPAASVLARTMASPWSRAAIEGAQQGAIYADPDEQGKGALIGSVLGTTLRGLGKAGGRALSGVVEKSDSAKALEQLAGQHGEDIFVPISQSASDEGILSPLVKGFYKEALPIVPTVKGQIEKQSTKAAEKLREIALKEALPTGGQLPANAGNKVGNAVSEIERQFDEAYDKTVKSYAFNVPKDLDKEITAAIRAGADPKTVVNKTTIAKVVGEVKSLFQQFSDGKPHIDGQNLLNVKRMISKLMGEADNHEKGAFRSADKMVDDLIETELKQGNIPSNLADLKRYKELTPAYRALKPVAESAEQAADKEGRFLFRTLAKNADNSPEQRALGQIGADTLDKSATSSSLVGKILGGAATGGAGIGAFMAPLVTAGIVGGGRALASKPVQKALLGDTKTQKFIIDFLRRNSKLTRRAGSLARGAAVQTAVGDQDE